jgi:anti-sigma B factor antagonist
LELSAVTHNGVQIYRLHGDLRRGEPVDELKAEMDNSIASGQHRIVVNLTDVNMVDSSGIGVIVRAHTTVKEKGGSLMLVNPSKFTMQTLKIVGLLNILKIHSDEEAAIADF